MRTVFYLIVILAVPSLGFSSTLHVPATYSTIQQAIDAASKGDTVLVQPGTYVENIDFLGKSIVVTSYQGPEVTVIDGGQPINPDVGSVVLFQNGENSDSVLEGFTLTNGTGTWLVSSMLTGNFGGGISCSNGSSPIIRNNIITKNTAFDSTTNSGGGGIDCQYSSSPLIENNIITDNHADWAGGFEAAVDSAPIFTNNVVSGNTAIVSGGACCIWFADSEVSNNMITGNSAQYSGGIQSEHSNPTIKCNYISNNNAKYSCGGIRCWDSTALVDGNVIINNSGKTGGGLAATKDDQSVFTNNLLAFNSATTNGGGFFCTGSQSTLVNNIFLGNTAEKGGGMDIFEGSFASASNNSFIGNSANRGGGMAVRKASSAYVENTVFWNNQALEKGPEIFIASDVNPSDLTIEYSDVEGGQASVHVDPGCTLTWGPGMIDADPLFIVGAGGLHYLSQEAAGQSGDSPCVDAGSDSAYNLNMHGCWTRTDSSYDSGMVDLGFHYGPHSADWTVPLYSDTHIIQETVGCAANLMLTAGSENAHRNYLIVAGISGTEPGTSLPGGLALLPVNWDVFTDIALSLLNTPIFSNFAGVLDAEGSGSAQLNAPPIPGAAGVTLYFAYCCNNPFDFVSNPVEIEIVQ